ncbi:MAG: hypothetical protein HQ557_17600 [Bacteroidetes bacterium]|nr:hypothetical protein [Bacteroidota bacterium]
MTNSTHSTDYIGTTPDYDDNQTSNIVTFPSLTGSSATQNYPPQSTTEQHYQRIVEELTNRIIQENNENPFNPIYFCDLQPDSLLNSVSFLRSFATRIEDKSHEIDFEDNEI